MRAILFTAGVLAGTAALAGASQPAATYQVVHDARRCPSPWCGGYWVRALNKQRTTCFDGTRAEWCYVAEIDFSTAGWTQDDVNDFHNSRGSEHIAVHGALVGKDYPAVNDTLGVLEAQVVLKQWVPRATP